MPQGDWTVVGALVTAVGALFLYVKTVVDAAMRSKDAEIDWLRKENAGWSEIAKALIREREEERSKP